jgi:hypothetical protein
MSDQVETKTIDIVHFKPKVLWPPGAQSSSLIEAGLLITSHRDACHRRGGP